MTSVTRAATGGTEPSASAESEPGQDAKRSVIAAIGVSVGYGAVPVVRDLDLHVERGEIVVLLGSNGAGKTATLMALSGELKPMRGEIFWQGRRTTAPLHRRAKDGLRYVTEDRSIFPNLTAGENLRLGGGSARAAVELFPELEPLLKRSGRLLSGGEQQMLALGRALSSRPALLLADELSLGLAPIIVNRLLDAIQVAARESGTAVVLVEQKVRQALGVADRAYVLRRGRVEIEGDASDLLHRIDEIEATYLSGRAAATTLEPSVDHATGDNT
jgi:branched-chain amino acid transport system ATP-binding protein